MVTWLVRRALTSLLLIFLVMTAVFFVVRLAPGDPLDQVVQEEFAADDRVLLRQSLGLDDSLVEQYLHWLAAGLRGDFGASFRQQRPVGEIIAEALPATLLLTTTAYGLHLILAVIAGVFLAVRRGSRLAHAVQAVGLALYSLPGFWLGLMLILLFSRLLGWLPAGGMQSPDAAFMPWPARQLDLLQHLALPVLVLAAGSFMGTARYLRASLEEVLEQDYILAARSRGVPERAVVMNHGLRNALLPVITLIGLSLPFLLGGAVVVEVVFGWPGMGRVAIEAIWARDYPVVMATTLVSAVTVVVGSLLADLLYAWADPRVKEAGKGDVA
jgi:peptide/nickel transport system permease protein